MSSYDTTFLIYTLNEEVIIMTEFPIPDEDNRYRFTHCRKARALSNYSSAYFFGGRPFYIGWWFLFHADIFHSLLTHWWLYYPRHLT